MYLIIRLSRYWHEENPQIGSSYFTSEHSLHFCDLRPGKCGIFCPTFPPSFPSEHCCGNPGRRGGAEVQKRPPQPHTAVTEFLLAKVARKFSKADRHFSACSGKRPLQPTENTRDKSCPVRRTMLQGAVCVAFGNLSSPPPPATRAGPSQEGPAFAGRRRRAVL